MDTPVADSTAPSREGPMTLAAHVAEIPTPSPTDAPGEPELPAWDIVEEWGLQSFPASDPPANW
jgi:hypothetical protein